MQKLYIILLIISTTFSCKKTETYDQETADVINTFYGDALGERESYNLLRSLSKDVGQRLSGSEGAKKAVLWSKEVMENYGFDSVFLQEVMVPHWERGDYEECFYYEGGEKVSLSILGAGGTVSTPVEGVTAEVVEVKSLDEVDMLGRDGVEGKIVFYNKAFNQRYVNIGASYGETGFQRRLGAIKASEYGAVASVFRSLSSGSDDFPHTGGMSYKEGVDSIAHGGLGVISSIKLSEKIKKAGISSIVDLKKHNLNYKIRDHSLAKIPLLLICGKKEVDSNSVTIRRLDSNKQENMDIDLFLKTYSALNKVSSN